jgi:hypothetical protein
VSYKGEFDENMKVFFTEVTPSAPDLSHLQGIMFADQPDLWRARPKKTKLRSRPLPSQPALSIEEIQKGVTGARETC